MNILSDYQKVCPVCQEYFEAKRTNQIYCSPRCKVLKNNNKAKMLKEDYEAITYQTNQILWSIRNFLKEHVGEKLNYNNIDSKEFQLRFVTNFYKDEKLKTNVLVVYDYGYYFVNSTIIKIIKYA